MDPIDMAILVAIGSEFDSNTWMWRIFSVLGETYGLIWLQKKHRYEMLGCIILNINLKFKMKMKK